MNPRLLLYLGLGALLLAGLPTAAQLLLVDRFDAVDAAADLEVEATAISISNPKNDFEAERELQAYVDEIALLAARLDADIAAGEDVAETRRTYKRIRALRLKAIQLAMAGRVELDPISVQPFEAAIDQLDAYHRHRPAPLPE